MFRLQDPDKLVDPLLLEKLRKKLDSALAALLRPSIEGGNPFLYSWLATKTHELKATLSSLPGWKTAATDGEKYFWYPSFLIKLLGKEIPVVLQHESLHVIYEHVKRFPGKDAKLFAYCIDFVANAHLENDFLKAKEAAKKRNKSYNKKTILERKTLWGGNIGQPISIDTFTKILRGTSIWPQTNCCFVDIKALHMSPEELYNQLKPEWDNSPSRCKECDSLTLGPRGQVLNKKPFAPGACKGCGTERDPNGPLDGHLPSKKSKQEVLEALVSASAKAEAIEPGSTPSYVEETINGLINPSMNLADHIRMSMLREARNDGMRNDWKRPRRRAISLGRYMPRRKTYKPKWLAMLDTSASMQEADIIYGLSQLQSLGYETEGLVVPCDAAVHWEDATEIREIADLNKTAIVGRGGTVFNDFFRNFPEKVGTEFDVVVIITDGICGPVPIELAPSIDCLWVVTRNNDWFNPPFGRVIPLR